MYYSHRPIPSLMPEATPDRGPSTDPNPGERSARADAQGLPLNSLGIIPARGNRAGGGAQIDVGARIGIIRNLEFSAGGRAHRISIGSFSYAGPWYDPKSGRMHTSTASDSGDSSVGPAGGNEGHMAMPPASPGAGAKNDATTGNADPGRRRDTKTP